MALYCETRTLPPDRDGHLPMVPLSNLPPGSVEIIGTVDTIGRRWTMEEARFRLRELGLTFYAPALGDIPAHRNGIAALLVLAEGIDIATDAQFQSIISMDLPVVILQEGTVLHHAIPVAARRIYTDDFASALYLAAWASTPERDRF